MAWPEVVFVGDYPYIVNRLAHLPDFAPHDMRILTYEPDDVARCLALVGDCRSCRPTRSA